MRTLKTQAVLIIPFLFFLESCQNQKSKDITAEVEDSPVLLPEKPTQSEESAEGPLEMKLKAIGLPEPHHYKVLIEWRATNVEPSVFFIIKRNDWNEGRVVQGGQSFYYDEQVLEGEKYTYQVQMINGPKTGVADWAQIKIPQDKVFEGENEIVSGKLDQYARVFLKNQVRLFWLGEDFEIKTQEIFSEGGVLEAFPVEQKQASVGDPGLHAGDLKIIARKLVGDLFIRADGQRGGRGVTGEKGPTGKNGGVGPDTFLHWGKPGAMPPGAALHRGYYFVCDPPRAPGQSGETGGQGLPGEQGRRGGNSAKVDVKILEVQEGEVFFTNRPGRGGPGGFGGEGGDGGEGGPPGQIDWLSHASKMPEGADLNVFHQCQPKQGDKGNLGAIGQEGSEGEEGYQALFCLRLGDVQSGHCPR